MGAREDRKVKADEKRKAYAAQITTVMELALSTAKEKSDPDADVKAFEAGQMKWNELQRSNRQEAQLVAESKSFVTGEALRIFKTKAPQYQKTKEEQNQGNKKNVRNRD